MESTRSDKQNMVGLYRPILCRNRRAFDQRQEIPLYAFARWPTGNAALALRHLVDFVDEDDAVVFNELDGFGFQLFLVEQLVSFLGDQRLIGVLHLDLALDPAPTH